MAKQASSPSSSKTTSNANTAKSNPTPVSDFVEQEWQKVTIIDDGQEWEDAEGGEEWECVACGKSFRSEAAWMSHERSRKHLKEVERLQREMLKEHAELGLVDPSEDMESDDENAEVSEPVAKEDSGAAPTVAEGSATPPPPSQADSEHESQPEDDGKQGSTKRRKGKKNARDSLATTVKLTKAELRAKQREEALHASSPFLSDSEPNVTPRSFKGKGKASSKVTSGIATPVMENDAKGPILSDTVVQNGQDTVGAEQEGDEQATNETQTATPLSKREKRRAKEAAKNAQDQEVGTSATLVSLCAPVPDQMLRLKAEMQHLCNRIWVSNKTV
ncbi:hypothetical protein FRC17_004823 [Serendipita sp. 399]|nr:hypothetical protein FRC17_004823 [Serendipita sp. 399]